MNRIEENDLPIRPHGDLKEAVIIQQRVDLLTGIAHELYNRIGQNAKSEERLIEFTYDISDSDNDMDVVAEDPPKSRDNRLSSCTPIPVASGIQEGAFILYDNFCLACFSRLFQRVSHRKKGASSFLFGLPHIPACILHVLKMLMYSGTLPEALPDSSVKRKRKRGADAPVSDMGTRTAAMDMLSRVCLLEPMERNNESTVLALSQLLWVTTSTDFKSRTTAINTISRYTVY